MMKLLFLIALVILALQLTEKPLDIGEKRD